MAGKTCATSKGGCKTITCPLCTNEGLALMALGLLLIYSGQKILQIAGIILIVLAYVVPFLRKR